MSAVSFIDGIERKLQEIEASVQQIKDLLPLLREAIANRPGIDVEIPTSPSTAAAIAPPVADHPEIRQRVVKAEPEDVEQEAQEQEKPQIVQGQKRRADDSSNAQCSEAKRARSPEEPNNEFTIFNYRGTMKKVTSEDVARTLPLLGAKGLFFPSDIELLNPPFGNACTHGINCLRFKIRGLMADQLRNWVNGQSYVEDSHLENTNQCSQFSQHSYLINDTEIQAISLFALIFLSAPKIENSVRTTVKVGPTHLEFWVPGEKRTVLTITELISEKWIPMVKKAYNRVTRQGRKALNQRVHMMGHPMTIWK